MKLNQFITIFSLCLLPILANAQDPITYSADSWINTASTEEHKEPVEITFGESEITLTVNGEASVFSIESQEKADHKVEYQAAKDGKTYTIKVLTFKNATILISGDDLKMAINAKT